MIWKCVRKNVGTYGTAQGQRRKHLQFNLGTKCVRVVECDTSNV